MTCAQAHWKDKAFRSKKGRGNSEKHPKIFMDGKEVYELRIHFLGEEFVWFEGITTDGKKIQSLCLKGTV